jgi:TonB family protein
MRSVLLVCAAFVVAGSAAAQVAPPSTRSGGADPRTLFNSDDYPPLAMKNKEQGTVQAELTVGTDGRVEACKILRSSNSSALDTATCNILTARAKFTPARNANGDAVKDRFVTPPIIWRIVEDSVPHPGIMQTQPGRYLCSAPAGEYFRQDAGPLGPGQSLRFGVRLLKDNFHPDYAPAVSIILGDPHDGVRVTIGEGQNDRQHLFVALQRAKAKVQEALFQFPLTNSWVTVELSLDKRGRLTIRSDPMTDHFSIGATQVAKTMVHCNSGEFEIELSPLPSGEALTNSN